MSNYVITINAKRNQPPSAVGDGSSTIEWGETLVFTRALLTTLLTPAYSDPEGDPAGNLRVNTVPGTGELQLDGVTVVDGQIISFDDIDNSLFTYVPDNTVTTLDNVSFDFDIADTGSNEFTG